MEYQILLLPRRDYWIWLSACRQYVLTFGANLTDDPATAGRYMAPRQVITLPTIRDGYPDIGEPVRWLQTHHPGVRIDAIEVQKPEGLRKELKRRVQDNDRYGAKRRPFYLLWPTDYPVITQPFGANPQIYRRYGMPGHEGVDLRALTNSNIYACADGEVYEVHTNPRDHAYGIHVRIQHRDGYKTVYAHLARALVTKGDVVQAGDRIGLADSTGNSSAAHLHLSLKRDGATVRRETTYPKDIIDPTPFLAWPAQGAAHAKSMAPAQWAGGRCLVGARVARGRDVEAPDREILRSGRAEAVLLPQKIRLEAVRELRAHQPGLLIAAQLDIEPEGSDWSPETFARAVEADMRRLVSIGVLDFEVHSEPNLTVRGMGRGWAKGADFGRWFSKAAGLLKAAFPDARLGFPMLSPGDGIPGLRESAEEFLSGCDEAVMEADWVGVACYWNTSGGLDLPGEGRAYDTYRALFPNKLLWLTGLGPLDSTLSHEDSARQVCQFLERARDVPGLVAAFVGTVAAGAEHEPLLWRDGDGGATELARVLGQRTF